VSRSQSPRPTAHHVSSRFSTAHRINTITHSSTIHGPLVVQSKELLNIKLASKTQKNHSDTVYNLGCMSAPYVFWCSRKVRRAEEDRDVLAARQAEEDRDVSTASISAS
jgi:hypothetical protein